MLKVTQVGYDGQPQINLRARPSFESIKACLSSDRGTGDVYDRCANPDDGDIRKYRFNVKPEDVRSS